MKNKKATIILGLIVTGVWGIIFFKIFYFGNDSDSTIIKDNNSPNVVFNDYSIIDTTHLLLNYRDPFGFNSAVSKSVSNPIRSLSKHSITQTQYIKELKPTLKPKYIRYSGYIKNAGSKRLLAMINISGRDVMMAEGESIEKVKLIKNLRDSIRVKYNGRTEIIGINETYP